MLVLLCTGTHTVCHVLLVQHLHPLFDRGMEGTLAVTQVHFCPSFMPHEERSFLRQLLVFAAENDMGPSVRYFVSQLWQDCTHVMGDRLLGASVRSCFQYIVRIFPLQDTSISTPF